MYGFVSVLSYGDRTSPSTLRVHEAYREDMFGDRMLECSDAE